MGITSPEREFKVKDRFGRTINYLRISITDKCNLRCIYCMPEEGVLRKSHDELISFEIIAETARRAAAMGIEKIRLTGGEPLVRRGIVDLIGMLRKIAGNVHLAMTTNGTLLADKAQDLKKAGLDSLNISLDALDPDRYRFLTRGGRIEEALAGIDAARQAGLPVKLNMVVLEDTRPEEIERLRRFCRGKDLAIQLINHYSLTEVKHNTYLFDRPPACARCNRIRLLCDGSLKPCLHSDREIRLDPDDIDGSLIQVVDEKPERGSVCLDRRMIEIGG